SRASGVTTPEASGACTVTSDAVLTVWNLAPSLRSRPMAGSSTDTKSFGAEIASPYPTKGGARELGRGRLDGAFAPERAVRLTFAPMNRHGLIAGATGTGKTRTLQVIAEQLSAAGVSVFAADVKGDVSGMALPGSDDGPAKKRATEL